MEFDTSLDVNINSILTQASNAPQSQQKPKRPHNAFNLYFLERQPVLKRENPILGGNEISKKIGEEWQNLKEEEKRPYVEKAKQIYEEFKKEHPNYHYEKSSDKKSRKKERQHVEPFFYNEISNLQTYHALHQTQEAVDPKSVLMWIGAQHVAKYILTRRDLMEDLSQSIQNSTNSYDQSYEVSRQ